MRIGIFSYFYFPTVNGVVVSLDNLRRGLEELGHEVYIFAPKSKKYSYPPQIKIINFPSININAKGFYLPIPLTLSLKIYQEIKRLNLDIIHTQHPFYIGESAFFYAKRFKIPLVFTYHSVYDLLSTSYLPSIFKKATATRVNRSVKNFVSRCDGVIAPNRVVKEKYLKGIKVKTAIIPTGIDLSRFQLPIKPIKNKFTFLTVARLSKEKNIEFLIKAFSLLAKTNKDCRFIIVGDGLEKEKLEKLVKAKKLNLKITFAGAVENKNIAGYYQKADVFLYSSLADTQALIIFEAMAAGLPIVTLDSPEMRCVIRPGKNGLLSPPNIQKFANQMEKLIKNLKLRRKLSYYGRKTSRYYSYQNMGRQVAGFYRKVIKAYR